MRFVHPEENTDVLSRYGNTGLASNSKVAAILAERQAEYDRMGKAIRAKLDERKNRKRYRPDSLFA